jgi:hypothetical protein
MTMLRIGLCVCLALFVGSSPAAEPTADEYQNALVGAIHALAESGDMDALRPLVEKHPKLVNERRVFRQPRKPSSTDDYTALHYAAAHGRTAVVEFLLKHKADPNADSGGGWTPLHLAARRGDVEVIRVLIEGGAKTDLQTTAHRAEYTVPPSSPPEAKPILMPAVPAMTPFEVAVQFKHEDAAAFLQKYQR